MRPRLSRLIDVPGAAIHAVETGPVDGPPVVLVHGFPETWWSWRHQLEPLAAAGFRVVAMDLRGYGGSSRAGPHDVATLADDVAAVARAVAGAHGKAAVVGHDWGGGAAWMAAARHPDAVARVAVLNCPLPHVLERVLLRRPSWEQLRRSWYMFFFQLPLVPEWLLRRENGRGVAGSIRGAALVRDHLSWEELAPFREAALVPGALRGMLAPYRQAFRDIVLRRRTIPEPPPLTQEALLIWGMGDPALGFDELVPGTERWVPRLRVERLDGVGHFPQSEAPARVNELLIGFLGR